MTGDLIAWVAVVALAAANIALFLNRDWRWSLGLLAIDYLAAFALTAQYWPLGLAAVKLITGWMATVALGMTGLRANPEDTQSLTWLGARPFRLFGIAIVLLAAFAAAPSLEDMLPGIGVPVAAGSLILAGAGLLQLGMTSEVLRVVVGLLTLLCGFETLYAAVESSILVAALLSVVNLGLALAGSYLLVNSAIPEEEESL